MMDNDELERGFGDSPPPAPEVEGIEEDIHRIHFSRVPSHVAINDSPEYPFADVTTVTITTGRHMDPNPQVVARMLFVEEGRKDDDINYSITVTDELDSRIITDGMFLDAYRSSILTNPWFLIYITLHAIFTGGFHDVEETGV